MNKYKLEQIMIRQNHAKYFVYFILSSWFIYGIGIAIIETISHNIFYNIQIDIVETIINSIILLFFISESILFSIMKNNNTDRKNIILTLIILPFSIPILLLKQTLDEVNIIIYYKICMILVSVLFLTIVNIIFISYICRIKIEST
ncbi:hypothetical protein GUI12_02890 [Anaplasmataceae bacterium AB001_6]|nr:hypothetical protein GUI12_02890 [Anaplasmataceae bacterium AB001_6]